MKINAQSGFALLLFLVILMGMGGVAGSKLLGSRVEAEDRLSIERDYAALKKAKQALLDYAVNYNKKTPVDFAGMGRLPCPDRVFAANPEGTQDGSCGGKYTNASGFLPWKTLGLEVLRDGKGSCLWYVVSGDYKNSPKADMLNEDSNGLLQVQDENGTLYHGANPGDRPIALVIDPGGPIGGQSRAIANPDMSFCRGNYTESNYLESGGSVNYATDHAGPADTIWTYVYGSISRRNENDNFNDKIAWISKKEYWDAVKRQQDLDATDNSKVISQLTEKLTECLAAYANHSGNTYHWLPWPATVALAGNEYRDDAAYVDQDGPGLLIGRLPRDIRFSDDALKQETGNTIITGDKNVYTDLFSLCPSPPWSSADQNLWANWKDHFFYAVSKNFQVKEGKDKTDPLDSEFCNGGTDCLHIGGTDVAGIVFYADSVTGTQSRNASPVDVDEKNSRTNYLEPVNDHDYPSGDGSQDYHKDAGDLAFCLVRNSNKLVAGPC